MKEKKEKKDKQKEKKKELEQWWECLVQENDYRHESKGVHLK